MLVVSGLLPCKSCSTFTARIDFAARLEWNDMWQVGSDAPNFSQKRDRCLELIEWFKHVEHLELGQFRLGHLSPSLKHIRRQCRLHPVSEGVLELVGRILV